MEYDIKIADSWREVYGCIVNKVEDNVAVLGTDNEFGFVIIQLELVGSHLEIECGLV